MSPQLVSTMKKDFLSLKLSGATIHFTPQGPIPKQLIQKLLKARLKEISKKVINRIIFFFNLISLT